MKKIFFILISTLVLASATDKNLINYQARYSLCHGKTNYQIAQCLLNGSLNYYMIWGDRKRYRQINNKEFKEEEADGNIYPYVMSLMPQSKRYRGLKKYIDSSIQRS